MSITRPAATAPVSAVLRRPAQTREPLRVLLLHGLASSGTTWDAFVPRVNAACEVWVASLPWCGEGFPRWAEQQDMTHWMAQALAAVPGGAHVVVAHSFSANVLLSLLDRADAGPWREPSALVLVSPFYRARPEDFDWSTISYHLNNFHIILAEGVRVRASGRLDPEVAREMALHVRDRVGPYGWVRFFDAYLRTPALDVGRITVPCLIIGGDRDIASFPSDSKAIAAALPDATLRLLPDCGHFAMIEHADDFAALVNDFLDTATVRVRPGGLDSRALEHHR